MLIHNRPGYVEELPEAERAELDADAIMKELTASGELVCEEALAGPSQTRAVRVRDDVPTITNGPYIGTEQQFVGCLLVDWGIPERALEIAAR
jgi:hypothetical protein